MKSRIIIGVIAYACLSLVASSGCETVRQPNHLRLLEPMPIASPEVERGQVLFMKHCHMCHPDGHSGLGPSLYSSPRPVTRAQVRLGVGGMPMFPEDILDDGEVDAIVAYLDTLRSHVKGTEESP